jgi:hypothetical protein
MDNLSSARRFENLPDLVEADQVEWREEELDDDVLERAALGHWPLGPPPPPATFPGLGLSLSDGPCPVWRPTSPRPVYDDAWAVGWGR